MAYAYTEDGCEDTGDAEVSGHNGAFAPYVRPTPRHVPTPAELRALLRAQRDVAALDGAEQRARFAARGCDIA